MGRHSERTPPYLGPMDDREPGALVQVQAAGQQILTASALTGMGFGTCDSSFWQPISCNHNPNLNADNAISGLRNSYRIQTDEGNGECRSGDRPGLSSSHGSLLSQATACVTVSRRVRRSRWSQCTDAPALRDRLGWYTVGLGRGMFERAVFRTASAAKAY
jgi:hypothetical protein